MNNNDILQKIQEIMREVLDLDDLVLTLDTTADDVEEWDSLSHINIIVAMEQDFGLKFALGELEVLRNVGDMVDLIKQKTGNA